PDLSVKLRGSANVAGQLVNFSEILWDGSDKIIQIADGINRIAIGYPGRSALIGQKGRRGAAAPPGSIPVELPLCQR
ncbi:MAG: hypothetical protein JXA18_11370, partial [Chitinispirillaceae bacterium]|nr:hypothetical protein [Chitinispirillaceae bacterium]